MTRAQLHTSAFWLNWISNTVRMVTQTKAATTTIAFYLFTFFFISYNYIFKCIELWNKNPVDSFVTFECTLHKQLSINRSQNFILREVTQSYLSNRHDDQKRHWEKHFRIAHRVLDVLQSESSRLKGTDLERAGLSWFSSVQEMVEWWCVSWTRASWNCDYSASQSARRGVEVGVRKSFADKDKGFSSWCVAE